MSERTDEVVGELILVGPVELVPEGTMTAVGAGAADVLLANVDGEILAVDNLCTHAGGWLDMGELHPETCEVECPLHDGRFDLRTGRPTREPCTEPVASYRVVVVDDQVYVRPTDG
jgi:nitrite reductase/ring-hydroxylating ferredoxin subunit